MKIDFTVQENNKKLSELMTNYVSGITLSAIKQIIKRKEVKVNSKKVDKDFLVKIGDNIEAFIPEKLKKSEDIYDIIYKDENILIVNKPILMEVETHLLHRLLSEFPTIKAVHRLDRNTSGLVIFTLNDNAYNEMIDAFKNRNLHKFYLAEVLGKAPKKQDVMTAYLKKDKDKSISYISDNYVDGYEIIKTAYKVIEQRENYTILEVELITGKTHQIRAHLAHIGCPIVGDGKYGDNKTNKRLNLKFQQLKAYKLVFDGFTKSLKYLNGQIFSL